jgi:hypothetical protein
MPGEIPAAGRSGIAPDLDTIAYGTLPDRREITMARERA